MKKKRPFITMLLALLLCTAATAQQGTVVSGKVTDSFGEPVVGAVVMYEGTNTVATTNAQGMYTIRRIGDKKLQFSALGMKSASVEVGDRTTLDVTMEHDAKVIKDVVAIGYGSVRRKDLTGSVASVGSEELKKSGSTNVMGALQGRVAGFNIVSQSGEPGAGFQYKIRGNNSINAGTSPLFVIDGMQMDASSGDVASSSTTGYGTYDPLSFLNPSDIESIEVLKDASATAIYGSRGANGVVLITTKSGAAAAGRTDVFFDASTGVSTVPKYIDMLGAQEYVDYRFNRKDYGWTGYGTDTNGDEVPDVMLDVSDREEFDWQKIMYRTAITQNYNVSVNSQLPGGTGIVASAGYLNQQGLIINNGYQRYTGRIKVDQPVGKKVKIGVSVNYGRDISDGAVSSGGGSLGYSGLIQMIYLERPLNMYTESDTDYPNGWTSLRDLVSAETFRRTIYQRTAANAYLNWDIIKGLQFRASASGSVSDSKLMEFYSARSRWGQSRNGYGSNKEVDTWNYNASATLTYKKSWNDRHNFDAMLGGEIGRNRSNTLGVSAYDYEDQSTGPYNIGKGNIVEKPLQSISESSRMSAFGRLNYNYASKYYVTLNMRADGSSKFHPGHRVGYFPSAALAWRASEESWLKGASWLSNLKLRLSAGVAGNDRIPTYAALARLGLVHYGAGGTEITGMAPTSAANSDLKWETTYQYDAGIDLGFASGRVELSADVYYKDTRDMLYSATLSAQAGQTQQWQNLGRVDNRGLEITLNTHNIVKDRFKWTTSLTFDMSRNHVRDIGGVEYTSVNIPSGQLSNDISRIMVGRPIGIGYGYVWDGNYQLDDFVITDRFGNEFPSSIVTSKNLDSFTYTLKEGVTSINSMNVRPGDRKYKDLDGDNEITTAGDRTVISDSNPDFSFGLGNTFNWRNFDLTLFVEGVFGRQIMNEFRLRSESGLSGGTQFNNLTRDAWNGRWTPENGSNTYSRLLNQSNTYVSSYYVEDGSYVRLSTVTLGYTFGKKVTKPLKIKSARLYFSVNNALLWTKYSGMDPDVSSANTLFPGFDRMSYPKARTFTFGLNMSF